jgi:hypothetical protein
VAIQHAPRAGILTAASVNKILHQRGYQTTGSTATGSSLPKAVCLHQAGTEVGAFNMSRCQRAAIVCVMLGAAGGAHLHETCEEAAQKPVHHVVEPVGERSCMGLLSVPCWCSC